MVFLNKAKKQKITESFKIHCAAKKFLTILTESYKNKKQLSTLFAYLNGYIRCICTYLLLTL